MKLSSTLRPFAWGIFGGAVAWWVVLAYVFGWTSPGTAHRQAAAQTEQAVVAALAPGCARKFLALPDVAEKKVTLANAMSWERRKLFPEAWVTLPNDTSPDPALIDACTKIVLEAKPVAPNAERDAANPPREG